MIKSRRKRSVGHVASMEGQERFIQGFGGETRGKRGFEELSLHGNIIFK